MGNKDYLVLSLAYEGCEGIFGPFSKNKALEICLELRKDAAENPWPPLGASDEDYKKNSDFWFEKWDLAITPRGWESICIQKSSGERKSAECVCREFGDKLKKASWIY